MALNIDFDAHNAEVREVWEAYRSGKPIRVPMILGISSRFTVLSVEANQLGYTYEQYFTDPDVMFEMQLQHQHWIRHNLVQDVELGVPDAWAIHVDLQNSYEQLWYGSDLRFIDGDVPDTPPFLTDENKWEFIEQGPPDPFGGWMGRAWEYYGHFQEKAKHCEFHSRPVQVAGLPGAGADGVFTMACALRGPTELCLDMYVDPEFPTELCLDMYVDPEFHHALMELITEATIQRIYAFRERLGQPRESTVWGYADDSIQLLSGDSYRELVLPYHRRLYDEFGPDGPNSIHLCGDATHLFKTIRDELRVMTFDTGFPVDHGWLRRELGPDVTIQGGPHVEVLRCGTPASIRQETKRILESGITEGGRFILREGNNLAPGTPPENVRAMYEACKEFGRYSD